MGNADLYVDWNIWDGLKLNLTGAAHFGGGFDDQYTESSNLRRTPESDSYYKYLDYSEEYTFTSTLSYGKTFAGKHDFYVMAGFEAKNASYSYLSATATDFPIDNPQSFALSTVDDRTASGTLSYDRFLSLFARLTYSYDNRYLFSANFRRDGSPKFGPTLSLYYPPFCIGPDGNRLAMSYGNQYMHDRNLPRFGYTDPAPLSDGVLRKNELDDTTIYYLSEEYMASQQLYRTSLGTPDYDYENFPDPRLFVCALQPFVDSSHVCRDPRGRGPGTGGSRICQQGTPQGLRL